MANQTGAARAQETPSSVPIQHDPQELVELLNGNLARRAYELYLDGGANHGNDLANWVQAESELLSTVPEIRELSSWYTVNVPVAGFTVDEVHVGLDTHRAIIVSDNQHSAEEQERTVPRQALFLLAEWPSDVDPVTATAYIKNETLTLTVKRAVEPKAE